MKVYLYIRLSSADKDLQFKTESESISNQRTLLRRFLQSRKEFEGCEVIEWIDDGYSGTNAERPSFERMIEGLKNGDSQVVICKDFSRFFRDYVEIGDYLERIFPFLGVRFIAVNDGYDSDEYKGSTAGMEVVMKYIVYAYYSRDLSQKVKTSFKARKKRGEYVAAMPPYGYMKDPDRKRHLVPNPDTAGIVRRIFDMAMSGTKPSDIAVTLNDEGIETPSRYFQRTHPDKKRYHNASAENCWTSVNVRQILRRQEYVGSVVSNIRTWRGLDVPRTKLNDESEWIIVPDCHEAIVSMEEFEKAQASIRKCAKRVDRSKKDYLLRGLIRCGACGRTMARVRGKEYCYRCVKSIENTSSSCPSEERFPEKVLEKVVANDFLEKMRLLVDADNRIQEAASKTKGSEENLNLTLSRIEKKKKQISLSRVSIYEQYADGKITKEAYLFERDKLNRELEDLTAEQQSTEQELSSLAQSRDDELGQAAERAREFIRAEELTNEMLLFFIDRVYVYSGMRTEIHYRFGDRIREALTAETDKPKNVGE